jgi:hypothetical protein
MEHVEKQMKKRSENNEESGTNDERSAGLSRDESGIYI